MESSRNVIGKKKKKPKVGRNFCCDSLSKKDVRSREWLKAYSGKELGVSLTKLSWRSEARV